MCFSPPPTSCASRAPSGDGGDARLPQGHGDASEARRLARLRAAGLSPLDPPADPMEMPMRPIRRYLDGRRMRRTGEIYGESRIEDGTDWPWPSDLAISPPIGDPDPTRPWPRRWIAAVVVVALLAGTALA
jgi:hypothetical protein